MENELCSEYMRIYNKQSTNNQPTQIIKMVASSFNHKNIDIDSETDINNCESETYSKSSSSKTTSTLVPIVCASANLNENNSISVANVANTSQKMGSRRIFTPQFKLQVLESYRNDNDCKGNQRATARKYNIHRRQIQKWLQCEANLRSSVTSVVQNNVKHQFHNISHRHHQLTPNPHHIHHMQPKIVTNGNNHSHFGSYIVQHQTQSLSPPHHRMLSLETVKQSTALHPGSIEESSKSSCVKAEVVSPAQDIFAGANLAAVVAAAAGAMAIVSTTSAHSPTIPTSTTPILRPTAVGGRSGRVLSPTMHHNHHHPQSHTHLQQHNYHNQQPHNIPMSYNHTPVSVAMPLPIIPHRVSPQAIHHNFNNQYHSILTHTHSTSTRTATATATEMSTFMPTVCLPLVSSSALTSTTARTTTTPTIKTRETTAAANPESDTNSNNNTTIANNENSFLHCKRNSFYNYFEKQIEKNQSFSSPILSYGLTPIDLSIGERRNTIKYIASTQPTYENLKFATSNKELHFETMLSDPSTSVVDLTSKKRKAIEVSDANAPQPTATADETLDQVKKYKLSVEDDIEVEVASIAPESDNKVQPPLKPIKLFKPYLLDEQNDDDGHANELNPPLNVQQKSEQQQPIIWSNHPACLSAHNYDNSCSYNFQCPNIEKQQQQQQQTTFLLESPCSYERSISSSSPQSALSPGSSSVPAISPISYSYIKGSPVSGYESSSSTCSESISQTNFYVKNYEDNRQLKNNVQKWLDHDTETNHHLPFSTGIAT